MSMRSAGSYIFLSGIREDRVNFVSDLPSLSIAQLFFLDASHRKCCVLGTQPDHYMLDNLHNPDHSTILCRLAFLVQGVTCCRSTGLYNARAYERKPTVHLDPQKLRLVVVVREHEDLRQGSPSN